MISPVSDATQVQAQTAVQPSQTRQPARAASPPTTIKDTIQLSNAAKILQEATETPAQTAQEAVTGDLQAKALLAREAAAHASGK